MSKPAPIQEFVPTNVISLDDLMEGVGETPETPLTVVNPPAPEPSPAPVEQIEEPTPGDLSQFVPDNSHLTEPESVRKPKADNSAIRKQLEKVAAEKAEYEAKTNQLQQQWDAEKARVAEIQAKYEAVQKEHEALSVRSQIGNPMAHPDVRKLTEPWNAKLPQLATQLRESGLKVHQLDKWLGDRVGQYMQAGDPESDEFVEKMESLRDEVDAYTSGIRRESDRASAQEKLMGMIRDGANVGRQVRATVQEMQANAPVFHYREQLAVYENEAREYDSIERDFFNPTEDIRMNDPMNQRVILRAMIDGSEEVKKAAQNAKIFSKMAVLPVKPINPQELEQVEPDKRQEVILRHLSRHNEVKKRAAKLIPEALVAYAVLPALWQELEQLRKKTAGDRQVPRPGQPLPKGRAEEEESLPITEFTPVGADLSKIPL